MDNVHPEIGNIAEADTVVVVPGLPKNSFRKIMRRIVRSIAKGEAITQDISDIRRPIYCGENRESCI